MNSSDESNSEEEEYGEERKSTSQRFFFPTDETELLKVMHDTLGFEEEEKVMYIHARLCRLAEKTTVNISSTSHT